MLAALLKRLEVPVRIFAKVNFHYEKRTLHLHFKNVTVHTFQLQTLFRPESTSKALPTFKPGSKKSEFAVFREIVVSSVSIFRLLCLLGHSQEIIDKLTEAEEELREQLEGEIREKEYLQECLDETGQILYQLKNNEQRLLEDKDTLLDDLENELQVCTMV